MEKQTVKLNVSPTRLREFNRQASAFLHDWRNVKEDVDLAISRLSEEQLNALRDYFLFDYSFADISKRQNLDVEFVRDTIQPFEDKVDELMEEVEYTDIDNFFKFHILFSNNESLISN